MASSALRKGHGVAVTIDRACLKAPCYYKLYTCWLYHDTNEYHQLDRFSCEKFQHAQQTCKDCSTLFGEYYCSICHLFDKDKKRYHCESCEICRTDPKEDFFPLLEM